MFSFRLQPSELLQQEGRPARTTETMRIETGQDLSVQASSIRGESISVGVVLYVDPADPRRSIHEMIRSRRPFQAQVSPVSPLLAAPR